MRGASRCSLSTTPCIVRFNQCTPCGVQLPQPSLQSEDMPHFNQRAPCGVQPRRYDGPFWILHISINAPRAGCNLPQPRRVNVRVADFNHFNLMHPMRGATTFLSNAPIYILFQSNAPRVGCNSKTIQSKRILVAHRLYSFANYVLYAIKHSPTYCIGITLKPLIFGAKLTAILCSLEVRTASITLL